MSPTKEKLQRLARELCEHGNRAENSAKTFALASLRTPVGKDRDEAMLHAGRAEGYRDAAQILEDAARGID